MRLHPIARTGRGLAASAALLLLPACTPGLSRPAAPTPSAAGVRIYDTGAAEFVSLSTLAERLSPADVILFGEQHDDDAAHRLQLALLEEMARRPRPVVLGLESFERDVQPLLDDYMAGRAAEEEFLRGSRPWPNYRGAYRPLVELARAQGWRVVASNVPRPLAALVARGGLDTLLALPPGHRARAAEEVRCPRDAYYERFAAEMGGHGHGAGGHPGAGHGDVVGRFYEAQCVKDETMAESIARALEEEAGARVLHVHGAFHGDFRQGIVPRLQRRAPGAEVRTISVVAGPDPGTVDPAAHRERADFVVFTRASRPAADTGAIARRTGPAPGG